MLNVIILSPFYISFRIIFVHPRSVSPPVAYFRLGKQDTCLGPKIFRVLTLTSNTQFSDRHTHTHTILSSYDPGENVI